mmetsp:Transcript_7281/g.18257  ORF Transcript_7281/g.18257 Transcript_7281/m.18257 type:complete len:105 (+) Transcript_7281:67-381(+)
MAFHSSMLSLMLLAVLCASASPIDCEKNVTASAEHTLLRQGRSTKTEFEEQVEDWQIGATAGGASQDSVDPLENWHCRGGASTCWISAECCSGRCLRTHHCGAW